MQIKDTPPLMEYDFLQLKVSICRVFSCFRIDSNPIALLRYWYDSDRGWIKPPKYSTEKNDSSHLEHYGCETKFIDLYGIRLGAPNARDIIKIHRCTEFVSGLFNNTLSTGDVIQDQEIPHIVLHIARTLQIPRHNIGITGSILVGKATTTSDIDMVVYSDLSPDEIGIRLASQKNHIRKANSNESLMLKSFTSTLRTRIRSWDPRAIYSLSIGGRKVDLHYASLRKQHVPMPIPRLGIIETIRQYKLTIIDDKERHYFPSQLLCKIYKKGNVIDCDLLCMDHSIHFVLKGDAIECIGSLYRVMDLDGSSKRQILVVTRILSVYPDSKY